MARIDYLTEQDKKRFEMAPEFTSSNERNYFSIYQMQYINKHYFWEMMKHLQHLH